MIDKILERSLIILEGNDRHVFLQGLITANIKNVTNNDAIYACMLTPQGKYLADFFIIDHDNRFYIDLPSAQKDNVITKFKLYKLRSKIEIIDVSNDYFIYSLHGDIKFDGIKLTDPRNRNLGYRLYSKSENLENTYSYEKLRIESKVPEGEKDLISGKSFPLEFGLEKIGAIDFKKGCYVGQEPISRTYHRGVIRKNIYKVSSMDNLPESGTKIFAGNIEIGTLCSTYQNIGLSLLRNEEYNKAAKEGGKFVVGLSQDIEINN